jgi:Flp pilus assembly protein TadG
MRWASRVTAERDRGTAALVAILFSTGVIVAMAALSVDVGQLYVERRQLQSGADAAALAVAQDAARGCVGGVCTPRTRAQAYADANAGDGASALLEVCGAGYVALAACPAESGAELTKCPAPPTGATQWVRVRTATGTSGGTTLLPPTFARALSGAAASGTTVAACGQVAWGAPDSLVPTVPLAISMCDWNSATANGANFAPPPPYTPAPASYPASTFERPLVLHSSTDTVGGCGSVPGGFGWIDADGSCRAALIDDTAQVDPGVSGSTCGDRIRAAVGSLIYVPVFTAASGTGTSGQYQVDGFAAFFVTGYSLAGVQPNRQDSIATGRRLCTGNDKCIYGYFTQGLAPTGGTLGGGDTPRGASIVQLIG